MSDIFLSLLAGALAGAAACVVLLRFNLVRPASTVATTVSRDAAPASATVESTAATDTPAPNAVTTDAELPAAAPASTLAAAIAPLAKTLSPLADDSSHPGELVDMPEFQAVLAALRRPDATTETLGQYALGDNWPLQCAALTVLMERPDRHVVCEPVQRHLPHARPFVVLYLLRFLLSLESRPPVGAAVLAAQGWWHANTAIVDAYEEYFRRSEAREDPPSFGNSLAALAADLDSADVVALLRRIRHSYGTTLLQAWRSWQDTRIDRAFLATVGTLREAAAADPLLVAPAAWQRPLEAAETVIRQSRPRSILVAGDPAVGKTAFIALLGARLQAHGWTVFAASGNELMADQMYIGQLEGRVRKIVEALHARRRILWSVGDFVQLLTAGVHQGQSAGLLDQMLPAIAAGELVLIGESTQAAAVRLFQLRPSLRALLEVVLLDPMDAAQTAVLAREVAGRIALAGPAVPESAVAAAMELAQHYLDSGQLPGIVLDLLKRAADHARATRSATLTPDSVVATLSQISGLPSVILDSGQRADLAGIRAFFEARVMGQPEAVAAVVGRIAMLKAGLVDPGKPIGVFLFAGPTGTGKTELARTLAEFLFGAADRLVRLDMSEFQAIESTAKILGHRDGSGDDSLAARIRKQPFSVILLDEFEKANPSCWDLFLQIFDAGRLSDAQGGEVDFRHCIVILTSNLGATQHRTADLGFRPQPGAFAPEQVMRAVSETFRPEFVNRLDKVIVFRPLTRELMRGILHKELARIEARRGLRERAWAVEWEASAIELLLDRGFSPEMGARPLKRAIDQLVLAPLAATLVEHRFPQGDQFLFVRAGGDAIEVEFVDPDAEPAGAVEDDADARDDTAAGHSLPAIVLGASGSSDERATLRRIWRQLSDRLNGAAWQARTDEMRLALADPAIWSRDDRHRIFARIELADRIAEASRTADRLFRRYDSAGAGAARASRELAGRLALQLHVLQQGIDDLTGDAPVDVLLRIEPALEHGGGDGTDAAAWRETLTAMYRQWVAKRRLHLSELAGRSGAPILLVGGFGAFRTLKSEAGLHLLEDERPDNARRIAARVRVIAGPEQPLPATGSYAVAAKLIETGPAPSSVVRRYREAPAALVRDVAGGWRSGRLGAVLGGDFDLIGAMKQPPAAD